MGSGELRGAIHKEKEYLLRSLHDFLEASTPCSAGCMSIALICVFTPKKKWERAETFDGLVVVPLRSYF